MRTTFIPDAGYRSGGFLVSGFGTGSYNTVPEYWLDGYDIFITQILPGVYSIAIYSCNTGWMFRTVDPLGAAIFEYGIYLGGGYQIAR